MLWNKILNLVLQKFLLKLNWSNLLFTFYSIRSDNYKTLYFMKPNKFSCMKRNF